MNGEEITQGGLIENEEKSQNTCEAVRIKQRKNLCLSWESNFKKMNIGVPYFTVFRIQVLHAQQPHTLYEHTVNFKLATHTI